LPPLTFYEYLDLLDAADLVSVPDDSNDDTVSPTTPDIDALNARFVHYVNFGGYPEVIFSDAIQSDPARFIKSDIIDKVLLRDLPSLYGIQDIQELNSLFTNLAYNTATEVSLDELSKKSGVSKPTIKRYIEYLEAAFLLKSVHRIDRSAKRFQRANFFKVYLTNPSMRAALFSPTTADDPAMGVLAETAVFAQWFHMPRELHYARWNDGEVDIVYLDSRQNPQWAVEVKWSDRFLDNRDELTSVWSLCHKTSLERVTVTSRTKTAKITHGDVTVLALPTSVYCFTVGYTLIRGREYPDGIGNTG
jgi:predicted AAA+ superfamily ATPase